MSSLKPNPRKLDEEETEKLTSQIVQRESNQLASPNSLLFLYQRICNVMEIIRDAVHRVCNVPEGMAYVPSTINAKALISMAKRDILGGIGLVIEDDRSRPRGNANSDLTMNNEHQPGNGVYRLLALPGMSLIVSVDPKVSEAIFLNEYEAFGRDPGMLKAILDKSLINQDPTTLAWRQKRRAVEHHLGNQSTALQQRAMKDEINTCLDELKPGAIIDAFTFTQRISFGVMNRLMIGAKCPDDIQSLKNELDEATKILKDEAVQLIFNPLARNDWLLENVVPLLYRKFNKTMNRLRDAIQKLIKYEKENIKNGKPSNTFLTSLLTPLEDPKVGRIEFSDEEILDEFIMRILAGSVTTSNTLGYQLHLGAAHPTIEDKIWEETGFYLENLGKPLNEINEIKLDGLDYTLAAFFETLRIYPSAAAALRVAKKDSIVEGVRFRKGDFILLDIYHPQVDETIFPMPFVWNPDRMANRMKALTPKQKRALHSFGFGKTICPGKRFAMIEYSILKLALRERGIAFAPYGDFPIPSGDVTMEPKNKTYLQVIERQ